MDILVTQDDEEAFEYENILKYLNKNVYRLLDIRASYLDDLTPYRDELVKNFVTLNRYYQDKNEKVLVVPLETLKLRFPKKNYFSSFTIEYAQEIDIKKLKNKLLLMGYYFVNIVTDFNEVSIRGDIIDIYPPNSSCGYRISLFDDYVEDIKEFDVATQKSIKDIDSFEIFPAFLDISEDEFNKISEKIQESQSYAFIKDIYSLGFWFIEKENILTKNSKRTKDTIIDLEIEDLGFKRLKPIKNIRDFIELNENIILLSSSEAKLKLFNIDENSVKLKISDLILNHKYNNNFIISLNKPKNQRQIKKFVLDELKIGDFVVHQNYGIGKFINTEIVNILGSKKEVVTILYANGDKLLLPIENIDLIDKYIADNIIPTLDKLGKGSFAKLKQKVQDKLFKIAKDIIEVSAKRNLVKGKKFEIIKDVYNLRLDVDFEYTKDQIKVIEDIFVDLNSSKVMDRLLCADVGFGKTEVALNAMFLAFLNSYQSLFIAPTTLLVNQQYNVIKNRLEKYNVKVAKIDGKTTTKQKNEIKKLFLDKKIDILVGTHAIFSIKSDNIGLIVIDEEHKFGVKQKEKIKEISINTHILSMSATPIPRTLNLALNNIKSISTILTPPINKIGVRTYLKNYNNTIIKEAILKEKRRGGQSFYIYNNIELIEQKKLILLDMLPNFKIEVIHSKVKPKVIEDIMQKFIDNKIDILLSTSIVESGLHLPNANTIIIDGANRFGIADLHQLRGRVGRGDKMGYCYLLVEDKENLAKNSLKRLLALSKHSDIGSGMELAYYDLEIRGAGNIIGEAQSGHIKGVGYNLYIKMLEDTIKKLTGKEIEEDNLELKLSVDSYINSEYIADESLRLEIYRKLANCKEENDVYEIEDELVDRFGKIDNITKDFLNIIIIKILAKKHKIKSISNYKDNITFVYENKKETIKSFDTIKEILKYLKSLGKLR